MEPLETYLRDLHAIRGQGVAETSGYGPLATLCNEIGATRASMNIAATRRKVAVFVASQWAKPLPLAFRS